MLADIPLKNRERSSPLKKLCTAVSRESPDLFRIDGVPCIDRGPDKSGPPVPYEHWNDSGSGGDNGVSRWQQEGEEIKKTANFARPSSVSADTPNFFKIPGVAINSSSAITGVEAVCSPPPQHRPFSLQETYMHGRDATAVADSKVLPGRWRETDREIGQWGHATREFHRALVKMRNEVTARTAQPKFQSQGELTPYPSGCGSTASVGTTQQQPCDAKLSARSFRRSGPVSGEGGRRSTPQPVSGQKREKTTSDTGREEKPRGGGRRASAVETFMSRLEGERGPRSRRESIAAFKKMLVGCPTNNSVEFEYDGTTAVANRDKSDTREAKMAEVKKAALRKVLARRAEAQRVVSRYMGREEGSYMLSRDADASKIFLGRKQEPKSSVGVVRVSAVKT